MPKLSRKTSLFAADCAKERILSVTNLSSRPPKFALFLASDKKSYFFGFFRREPAAKASFGRVWNYKPDKTYDLRDCPVFFQVPKKCAFRPDNKKEIGLKTTGALLLSWE